MVAMVPTMHHRNNRISSLQYNNNIVHDHQIQLDSFRNHVRCDIISRIIPHFTFFLEMVVAAATMMMAVELEVAQQTTTLLICFLGIVSVGNERFLVRVEVYSSPRSYAAVVVVVVQGDNHIDSDQNYILLHIILIIAVVSVTMVGGKILISQIS